MSPPSPSTPPSLQLKALLKAAADNRRANLHRPRVVDREVPIGEFAPTLRGYIRSLCDAIAVENCYRGEGTHPELEKVVARVRRIGEFPLWGVLRQEMLDFYDDYVLGTPVPRPANFEEPELLRDSYQLMGTKIMVVRAFQSMFQFVDFILDEFDGRD
jgi:hypothetical protein